MANWQDRQVSELFLRRISNIPLFVRKEIMLASIFDDGLEYSNNISYSLFRKLYMYLSKKLNVSIEIHILKDL